MGSTIVTDFGERMLKERYYYKNEKTPEELFKRVATAGSSDIRQSRRILGYLKKGWFMAATPVLSNLGTDRGLPISCFVNEPDDSKEGIFDNYSENFYLGAGGGGIGTDWSKIREIGAKVGHNGHSSGIIPFIKVSDSATLAVSQGGLRRASQAVYLDISHPEIKEFIEVRKPTGGGDANRRSLNIHHGVKLSDAFLEAVENLDSWDLVSPHSGEVVETVDAFGLYTKLLDMRMETGEPYFFFSDTVEREQPFVYDLTNISVVTSNLCTEIMLPTNKDRTAVCCLSSLNLTKYDEWKNDPQFIADVIEFLDNVLEDFIVKAKDKPGYAKAVASALNERSVGLGAMGFHTLLQEKHIPFESALAVGLNEAIFRHIKNAADKASHELGLAKGFAPIYKDVEVTKFKKRNVCTVAIAPTSSISVICGEVSPGIDPIIANAYTHRNSVGTTIIKNPSLVTFINEYSKENNKDASWEEAQWKIILDDAGSVANLEWMKEWDKDVFKTAFELDQSWIIEHAGKRQEFIDQGQSINLFFDADVDKRKLYKVHMEAWKKGCKSLYYCRSKVTNRASLKEQKREMIDVSKYEECLSCQ